LQDLVILLIQSIKAQIQQGWYGRNRDLRYAISIISIL
jgi:hypothetical protein